jgi:hypothetical protein
MKIFDLTNEHIEEAPIQMDPSEPNNPTVYGHEKANPMTLKGRIMQARAQLKELAKMADSNELEVWEQITKLAKGGMFMGLEQNFEQIRHGIGELAKKRRKGGTGSRGINKGIGEIDQATSTTPKQQDLGNGFTLTSIDAFGATRKAVLDTSNNTYYILNKDEITGSNLARTQAPYISIRDGNRNASMGGPQLRAAMMKAGLINETTSASSIAAVPNPGVAKTKKTNKIAKNALDTNDNLLGGKPIKR